MSQPSHLHPTEDQTVVDSSFAAEVFWEKNRSTIIEALAAIALLAIGVTFWLITTHNRQLASEALFAEAKTPDQWREVITKYPGTQPAANAYFLVAQSLREQGNLDESNKTYEKFLEVFPKNPLSGGARLGLAENLALQGKTDESLANLRQIEGQESSGYAAAVAGLIEGQTLIRQGKLADARKVFLNTAQNNPGSPVARIAGSLGSQLSALLPPEPKAAPAPAPTPAP